VGLARQLKVALSNGAAFLGLRVYALALCRDYRLRSPKLDWYANEQFNAYLKRFGEQHMLNGDRRWMIYQLLRAIDAVEGDTAECGVFRGASSYLICAANASGSKRRTHHLFDSFDGLSKPGALDGAHWRPHDLSVAVDRVRANMADFKDVEFHPGWIPEAFPSVADRKFAFVHIDVDLYEPTRDSMQFFYPRLSPGAILICDDYGFGTCPGATRAVDEYLGDKPEQMMALGDGGGFLIKGVPIGKPIPLP
jgi:O-methyltransferase